MPSNCVPLAQNIRRYDRRSSGRRQGEKYADRPEMIPETEEFLNEDRVHLFKRLSPSSKREAFNLVPKVLSEDQKKLCVEDSQAMIEFFTLMQESILDSVTCDGIWICYDMILNSKRLCTEKRKRFDFQEQRWP